MSRHITPTEEQLGALLASPHEGPIVMLNLLRFRPEGGAEAYGVYSQAVAPMLAAAGGRVIAAAGLLETIVGPPEGEPWDVVLLVEYPSREAFVGMVSTPEYQEAHRHRDEGLADSRLVMGVGVGV